MTDVPYDVYMGPEFTFHVQVEKGIVMMYHGVPGEAEIRSEMSLAEARNLGNDLLGAVAEVES